MTLFENIKSVIIENNKNKKVQMSDLAVNYFVVKIEKIFEIVSKRISDISSNSKIEVFNVEYIIHDIFKNNAHKIMSAGYQAVRDFKYLPQPIYKGVLNYEKPDPKTELISEEALIYVKTIIEYLINEIIDMANNISLNKKIIISHLRCAIANHPSLSIIIN